jgi:hypothetical protein
MTRPAATPVPRLLRGSVIIHRRRCGGPTCHCSDGVSLHESTVLSYSEAGRTRFLMLPPDTVGAVRTATDRYRAEKARLEERANQGLDALVATLAPPRRRS